ncbi:MAG: hypothetical protein PHC78_11050, partial [Verrucomicrobiota bacterium]|nr:hypothetical protein [Verrucomicrobiota bacterium]
MGVLSILKGRNLLQSDGQVILALDDSPCPKTGKQIAHAQSHFDHSLKPNSSRYIWGHCRVVMGLMTKIYQGWACLPL